MINIVFKENAQDDIFQIKEYISKDSVYYANKTVNEIVNKTEYLSLFPYMGRKIPEYDMEDLRELIYKSYRILYKVNSNIQIKCF